jgi:hypothetical protein
MRNFIFKLFLPIIAIGCMIGCQEDSLTNGPENDIALRSANNFSAPLSGANEVPPNESDAHGVIIVKIAKDESSIDYRLIVSNADSVTGAHFHLAAEGVNGPVVAHLYSGPVTGRHNGVLSQGTITAEDVVGPLAGDLQALIDTLRSGYIYTNVHTDFLPPGEIRGQVD